MGFVLAHFAVRGLMHEAALKADEDPDQLSFLHAVQVIRQTAGVQRYSRLSRKPLFIKQC
ncbi:MAG: hypothetical protein JO189_10315 [Deltaproteobacteria bacterium]|nr:hypothetical protein [Deltaproteobacteria bacterium]